MLSVFGITLLIYVLIGAAAGFIAGLFGVGGGILLVPCFFYTLSWLYPEAQNLMHISIGTALATIVFTGFSSVRAHKEKKNIDFTILYKLAPGIALGALLSALIASMLESAQLKSFFAFMIITLALMMVIGPEKFRGNRTFPGQFLSTISGVIIGCISGLMGIGGATFSVPFMVYFNTDMRKAVGTASALGLVISIPSVLGFSYFGIGIDHNIPYALGYIYVPALLAVIPLSMITATYGACLANQIDAVRLKKIFAFFMVVVALSMLYDELY